MKINIFASLLAALILLIATEAFAVPVQREVMGWLEKVRLIPGNVVIHAKLDTGADYSSLDAESPEEFEKEGKKWVRFNVESKYGQKGVIESPVVRTALIKKHDGKHQKRNVIRLGICLGDVYMEDDVNLVNRSNFSQQMLVGRNFLAGHVTIDPAVSYTKDPSCKALSPERLTYLLTPRANP